MSNQTTLRNTLKTLPLLSVLAIGLTLSPAISMADSGDRGQHKAKYSHDAGKSHSKGHNKRNYRSDKHTSKRHTKGHRDNHGHRSERHYSKGHGHHNKHAYYKRGHHNHGYGHRDHRGHSHTNYIVNDHYYSDGLFDLDHLRFMIGLHTDNLDITFRD